MATAAPASPNGPPTLAQRIGGFFRRAAGAILLAVLTAALTYFVTAKLNRDSALQQQYLSAVQEFVSTGTHVDAAVTDLSDSILDGKGVAESRKQARQAIAAHVAATQSLSQVVGEGNAQAYMQGLGIMRTFVDRATDAKSAKKASDARFDVIYNRQIIANEARKRIYAGTAGHT